MRKVIVIGSGGAGKSTFSQRLGEITGLPVVHLDAAFWRPGWVEPTDAEWDREVADLVSKEAWILDGNYGRTLEMRLQACDTAIFLDMPPFLCTWRVIKRWLQYRGRTRPDMGTDCPERLNLEFVRWVWSYRKRSRPRVFERLEAHGKGKRIIILRSPREVEQFLRGAAG